MDQVKFSKGCLPHLCRNLFLKEIFKYFDLKIIGKYLQNRKVIQKDLKTVVSYVGIVIVLVARSLMVVSSKLMRRRAVIIAEVLKMTW